MHPRALLGILLLLAAGAASCGGDQPEPAPAPPAASGAPAPEIGKEFDPAAPPVAEAPTEAPREVPPEPPPATGTGGLRDTVKTEPAPPEPAGPTWSLANTYEERVANVKAALATGPGPYALDLHDLGGWEFDERKKQPFPEHILALEGKELILRGFMLPDVDFENLKKFHLVRSLWGCCFGAPPGPNEIMRVTLAGEGIDYTYKTLEIRGTFRLVFEMTDGLLDDIYRLEATSVRELGFDDPLAPTNVTPEQRAKFEEFVPGQVEF
jgi:hypothetical protein